MFFLITMFTVTLIGERVIFPQKNYIHTKPDIKMHQLKLIVNLIKIKEQLGRVENHV